jgi:hypothetical protein
MNKTAKFEIDKLIAMMESLKNEHLGITKELNKEREQREALEKEKECTF